MLNSSVRWCKYSSVDSPSCCLQDVILLMSTLVGNWSRNTTPRAGTASLYGALSARFQSMLQTRRSFTRKRRVTCWRSTGFIVVTNRRFSSVMVGRNSVQKMENCSANFCPDAVGSGRCCAAAVISSVVHVQNTRMGPVGPDTSTMGNDSSALEDGPVAALMSYAVPLHVVCRDRRPRETGGSYDWGLTSGLS